MKKAVLIAVLVLLALRGAIWALEQYNERSQVAAVASEPASAPSPVAPAITLSSDVRVEDAAPADMAPIPNETSSAADSATHSKQPQAPGGRIVEPIFELPFGLIDQILEVKPNSTLENVVSQLNGRFFGKYGVPMAFYLDEGVGASAPPEMLDLMNGSKLNLPPPMKNSCGRKEYLLGLKKIEEKYIRIAFPGNELRVEVPQGFAAAKISSFKDGQRVATVYATVSRPPIAISDDGKKFFYSVFLPSSEMVNAWWETQKKTIKNLGWDVPFLVYSLSESGIEFSSDHNLYQVASYIPTPRNATTTSGSIAFDYDRGVSIEARGVCAGAAVPAPANKAKK